MKPFGVAVFAVNMLDRWRYVGDNFVLNLPEGLSDRGMTGSVFSDLDDNKQGSRHSHLNWCDTRADAESYAQLAAMAHPGCDVIVFESKTVYTSKATPPIRRQMTEKGILP